MVDLQVDTFHADSTGVLYELQHLYVPCALATAAPCVLHGFGFGLREGFLEGRRPQRAGTSPRDVNSSAIVW